MANIMSQKTKYLINKWGKRISLVEKAQGKALTFEKRAALANALENTSNRILAKEATNPGSIGAYKRFALDIVTASVPNLIAFDLVAVQSMDNRIGMINYLDYRYSRDKGQTHAGDVFNSSINKGKSDPFYSSDLVKDEVVAKAGDPGEITLKWWPVIPQGFTITYNGATGSFDAAKNTFVDNMGVPVAGLENIEISPAGLLKMNVDTVASDVVVTYRYNNEDVRSDGYNTVTGSYTDHNGNTQFNYGYDNNAAFTNVPEAELKINSIPVEAKARTMRAFWSFDAQYELQQEYGQDIETLLATQITGELAHEIDDELTLDLLRFADAGTPLTWSRTLTPGISLVDHYDSFNVTLTEGSNRIFDATRKVKANFMVCGLGVATVVESMRNFTPSGVTAVGPHFLGTLGNLKIYVNPNYPTNEFVLGYKGSTMFDAGYFYCPYMPVSSTDLIMDANFRGQRGWATMYGKKALNSKMYIRGKITD